MKYAQLKQTRILYTCEKKIPVSYARMVLVDNPKFVVRQGGRNAVLRDRQKNVHAFIKSVMQELASAPNTDGLRKIKLHPYKLAWFLL